MRQDHGNQLAVLAVQSEMGVSEFCTFLGSYLASVREMRFVRRDDAPHGDCLVLLTFDSAAMTAKFYQQHNQKPVRTSSHVLLSAMRISNQCFSDKGMFQCTKNEQIAVGIWYGLVGQSWRCLNVARGFESYVPACVPLP